MRSILVHAGRDSNSDNRVETALSVARATGGHVTLHINTPITAYVTMDPFGGSHTLSDILEQARGRADALAATLTEHMSGEDVQWSIESSEGDLADALVNSARLADLVVMSLGEAAVPLASRPPVGAVAINARTPVLALPDGGRFDPGGTAMIAWNGSHEAANALRAAVPLLRLCDEAQLVTIAERDQPLSPFEAAAYLSRHDVHATIVERTAGTQTVEEALLSIGDELGAELAVMGAYGHSRLRETLFGGVTRFAIDAGTRPLLLMH